MKSPVTLNAEQKAALKMLQSGENVFLTGAAGSGKSTVLREFLRLHGGEGRKQIPILASTGAAAILVGGRTFHSFFGLGILEGGEHQTVERALKNARLLERLRKSDVVVIDEVSMLSGTLLRTAETVARRARGNSTPWGGLRIIAVGDFAQLPPVNVHGDIRGERDWAFLDDVWERSGFKSVVLRQIMRSQDPDFLVILNSIRIGQVSPEVRAFLNARKLSRSGEMTHLFARRDAVEQFNLERLEELPGEARVFETVFEGKARDVEAFRKNSPLSDRIALKNGALIMLRQNDVDGRFVNGSLANVVRMSRGEDDDDAVLTVKLLSGGKEIDIERAAFTLLNADGEPVVVARNFPVSLAWAMTIHKAQGATLDRVSVDLRQAWEPGQAYVALSRARSPAGLFVRDWQERGILADPLVADFHARLLD